MENNDDKETGLSNMLPYRLEILYDFAEAGAFEWFDIQQMVNRKELDETIRDIEHWLMTDYVEEDEFWNNDDTGWKYDGNSVYAPALNLMHGSVKVTTFMVEIMKVLSIKSIEMHGNSNLDKIMIKANTIIKRTENTTDLNVKVFDAMHSFERGNKSIPATTLVHINQNSGEIQEFQFQTCRRTSEWDEKTLRIVVEDLDGIKQKFQKHEIIQMDNKGD